MIEWITKRNISWKLGILVLLMLIPIVVLGGFFLSGEQKRIAATQDKIASLDYLVPLRTLLQHTSEHRDFSARAVSGDGAARSRVVDSDSKIEKDFNDLETVDKRFTKANTTQNLTAVRAKWNELKANRTSGTVKETIDIHTKLINDILGQIRLVADNAIVTDQDIDTYYLGNAIAQQIPSGVQALGELSAYGSAVRARGKLTEEDRYQITALNENVNRFTSNIRAGLSTGTAGNADLRSRIDTAAQSAAGAAQLLVSQNDSLVRSQGGGDLETYAQQASTAMGQFLNLDDIVTTAYKETLVQRSTDQRKGLWIEIAIAFVALLLAAYLAFAVSRTVTTQIHAISDLFGQIGIGNFSARSEVTSPDELGQMAKSLNGMLDNTLSLIQSRDERDKLQQSIRKLLEEMAGVAEGDLTKEAEVTADVTGAIADSFNFMLSELRRIISTVQDTTLHVSSSANEVQTTTEHLALGSESQAMQIVEASASIDEIAVSIQQVSANASTASAVADQALKSAKNGSESVQKTITGMNSIRTQVQQTSKRIKRLGESSQEIGEIVQLIGDIADRTSILALNASIQAAMAGEAGKGFAVVAEEVERLAERSTEATKRIATLIKSIQSDTNEAISAMEETTREVVGGSNLANNAGQALGEIELVSNQLSEIISSISMASLQQARGSDSVAKSMTDISEVTQQTAAGAKQAAVSIRKLAELADELRGSLGRFKLPNYGHGPDGKTTGATGRWLSLSATPR